jgi:hypothetical protein
VPSECGMGLILGVDLPLNPLACTPAEEDIATLGASTSSVEAGTNPGVEVHT